MKEYELWLDESGEFKDSIEFKNKGINPSLIGGILVPVETLNSNKFQSIIGELDMQRNHANHFEADEKINYALPLLEKLHEESDACQVIFENVNYEKDSNHRQLYLRIMAEGLLQLMLTLNAKNEDVKLHVIIAQRQDVDTQTNRRINESEYQDKLREIQEKKKKEHRIILSRNSECTFEIAVATKTPKLCFADFVCNLRLTRNSKGLRCVKDRINHLYDNAYLFTLNEITSENFIKQCLVQNDVSEAIMELYTSIDSLNHILIIEEIIDKMKTMSYRLVKSQLKQTANECIAYVAKCSDYHIGQLILERINEELLPAFQNEGFNVFQFQFQIYIQLADLYLRKGDIVKARGILNQCKELHRKMQNSLENIFSYYQLLEKEAILYIDEFDYYASSTLMERVCHTFENVMQMVEIDDLIGERFKYPISEYYGDALCMRIYALMFQQRENPSLYHELVLLSDKALLQYPNNEGELERHRQYRSHIENECGNYELALEWLMSAKLYRMIPCTMENIKQFVKAVFESEEIISFQYYIMYYLSIMAEAKRNNHPLADKMHAVLQSCKEYLSQIDLIDFSKKEANTIEMPIEAIKEKKSNLQYHPMEINYWKYANYYHYSQNYEKAEKFYTKALSACRDNNYLTMRITGIGIFAERILNTACINLKKANYQYEDLLQEIGMIQKLTMSDNTKQFVDELAKLIQSIKKDNCLDLSFLEKVARKITY